MIEFAYCYNELGDAFIPEEEEDNFNYNFINILCVGRTNSGKSTFINSYFNKRKCMVGGSGLSTTNRVCYYNDFKNNIRFYDTVCFEGPTKNQIVKEILDKLKINIINANQKIHLILYFLGDAYFEEHEYDLFDEILEYKTHIIFIKNKAESDTIKSYEEEKQKLDESLNILVKKRIGEKGKKKCSKEEIDERYKSVLICKENIILMNLKKKKIKDSFIPIFGMKELFKVIYKYFKDQKIDMDNIKKLKDLGDHGIYMVLKDNLFLGSYTKTEDILNSIKLEKRKIIAANAFYAALSGIDPVPFVDFGTYYLIEKKLKRELGRLYLFDIDKNSFLNYSYNQTIKSENEIKENNDDKSISSKKGNKEKEYNLKKNIPGSVIKTGLQGGKITYEFIQLTKSASFINKAILTFANACKSSIILAIVGSAIGGILGAGMIIYEGNIFCKISENYLEKDRGKEYLTKAASNYNKAIDSIKEFYEKLE